MKCVNMDRDEVAHRAPSLEPKLRTLRETTADDPANVSGSAVARSRGASVSTAPAHHHVMG
jgi:hypothetical protein